MPITRLKHNNLTSDDVLTWQKEQAARLLQSWKDFSGEDMVTCDENSLAIIADALNEYFLFVNIPGLDEPSFEIVDENTLDQEIAEGEDTLEDDEETLDDDEIEEDDSDSDLEDPSDLDEECDSDLEEEDDDEFPLDERDDEDEPDEEEE